MENLIKGIAWLASTGRNGAREFAVIVDEDERLSADLEEALCWLTDISNNVEI